MDGQLLPVIFWLAKKLMMNANLLANLLFPARYGSEESLNTLEIHHFKV